MKNILFIADPLDTFKIYKDSTYVMMRELQTRGYGVWACEATDIFCSSLERVSAQIRPVELKLEVSEGSNWYKSGPSEVKS